MVLWSDIDKNAIEGIPWGKERTKFRYQGGALRFQIPRAMCTWGVSAYKSMQVDLSNPVFMEWWRDLETQLCPLEPFNTNLKQNSLRLKIDESAYVFDEQTKQICPEIKEGLFRNQEVSCMIDVDSTYFFNGNWGLTVKLYQIKAFGDAEISTVTAAEPSLPKGICAFLQETDAS